MKNKLFKISFFAGSILLTFNSFSQKINETSAALEYNKYADIWARMMMTGENNLEAGKKALLKAKDYIDLAAVHPETIESPKTLFYKGEIYTGLLLVSADDSTYMKENGEALLNQGIESYKKAFPSKKYKEEVLSSINTKKGLFSMACDQLYKAGKFKEAGEVYDLQVSLSDVVGEIDSSSLFNAGLCAEKAGDLVTAAARYKKTAEIQYKTPLIYAIAANALRKDGKKAEAKEILMVGRSKYPNDKDILLELVNSDIEAGDNAAAEKSLADAIAADPNNKQLYLTIGTIYIELKQDEKAEVALNKAIEIDPNYTDAQYQLGALLSGSAISMKQEASQLKQGDPNYEKMLAKADELYKKAVVPLEAYIAKNPNDKQVLIILAQIYRSLKNPEKSAEYKKRADQL
jgi:Tfp pilus assembly protein PilF